MGFFNMDQYQDLNPTLAAVAMFAGLGSFSFGYDNNWWGGVIGSTYFNRQFGSGETVVDGETVRILTASDTSTGTSLGTVGIILGCMIAPFINDRFGRKASFVVLGVVGIIGTLIQICCTFNRSFWLLVAGKVVVNASVGISSAVVGAYQAECAPARIRGAMVTCYIIRENLGTFVGNAVMLGVYDRNDSLVWLVPMGLQFFFPAVIVIGSPFLPESPRWLIQKDRMEDAYRSLRRLRRKTVSNDDVRVELEETRLGLQHHLSLVASTSWAQLFRGSDLRRTVIGLGVMCLIQGQGISFTNNYLNITLISLGFADVYQLLVIIYACKVVISLLGFYLPDRIGRRPLLLGGSSAMLICMLIIGACAAATDNHPTGSLGKLTLAGTFTWILVYSFTWGPVCWVTAAEISSSALREKTLALCAWGCFASGLVSNIAVPYIQDAGYGNLQGKIAFIFAGFTVFAIVFCLFVPELKGRSLEDLDLMFEAKIPARQFRNYDISRLKGNVEGLAEGSEVKHAKEDQFLEKA